MNSAYGRLRRRADFVAASKGSRVSRDVFTIQSRQRGDGDAPPRFGITITKKTAPHAVDRNRMRRRVREALRLGAALSGAAGHDYVIVGRLPLMTIPFDDLRGALTVGFADAARRGRKRTQGTTKSP